MSVAFETQKNTVVSCARRFNLLDLGEWAFLIHVSSQCNFLERAREREKSNIDLSVSNPVTYLY